MKEDQTILITPLVSSNFDHCVVCSSSTYGFSLPLWYLQALAIVLSVLPQYTDSDYLFGIFKLRGNHKLYIEEEQTTQWSKFADTKGVIRIRILKKNRQHNGQSLKITKG
jgi:ABC-type antimicrobial peptide transport system permease subunit